MSLDSCISRWPATTRWPWLAYLLAPAKRLSTDSSASLTCRNSGSDPLRPSIKTIQQRVPTLPTPATLRAMSANSNCSSRYRRSVSSVRRYLAIRLLSCCLRLLRSVSLGNSSSIGTSSGGSAPGQRVPRPGGWPLRSRVRHRRREPRLLFVIVEENHGFSDVIGNPAAPNLNALASQYGLATRTRSPTTCRGCRPRTARAAGPL